MPSEDGIKTMWWWEVFQVSKDSVAYYQRLMTSDILQHKCGQMYEPMRSRHLKNTLSSFFPLVLTFNIGNTFLIYLISPLYLALKIN